MAIKQCSWGLNSVKLCFNNQFLWFGIVKSYIFPKFPFFLLFRQQPVGADDQCFHIRGNFSFFIFFSVSPPSLKSWSQIPALRLKSQSRGSNPSLTAQIPGWRLKSQFWGSNPSLEAQIQVPRLKYQSRGSNPGLAAQILAFKPKFQPWGSHPSLEAHILAATKTA